MRVQAYLNFDGRCEEAVEFYKKAVGAQVTMMMRNKECPAPPSPGTVAPGSENKVLHVSLRIGQTEVMASDCYSKGKPKFEGISLSLSVPTEDEAERYFMALAEGGKVNMPLEKTFFSPRFGVLTDRFGVTWMIAVMQG